MPGVLDYRRYIELFYTTKKIEEHFPLEQLTINFDINNLGTDGWTGQMSWQTLIIDSMTYRFGEPNFTNSQVIGYFPEGSKTFVVSGQLQLPAYMYQGPIVPDSLNNVPITVVSFEFSKGQERFNQQLLLIENWHPGVPLGDPRLNANYTPIDGLESTLTLNLDKGILISGDTLTLTAQTDIQSGIQPSALVRFYRQTGATSQVLVGSTTISGTQAQITFNTQSIPSGIATFFATFSGGPQYRLVQSNFTSTNFITGKQLDVRLKLTPNRGPVDTLVNVLATATIAQGYESTSTTFITGTVVYRNIGLPPFTDEEQLPFTTSGTFVNGQFAAQFTINNLYVPYDPNQIPNTNYTIASTSASGLTIIYNLDIEKEYRAQLDWGPVYQHLLAPGSTSTILIAEENLNFQRNLEPVTVSVIDNQTTLPVTSIYNNTLVDIKATSNIGRSQSISAGDLQFWAEYTPNYNITDIVFPRTPLASTVTSSATLVMPKFLTSNQILVKNNPELKIGRTIRFPQATTGIHNTGTYTIVNITTQTINLTSGTSLITLNRSWTTHPYNSVFQSNNFTTANLQEIQNIPPWFQTFTGGFYSGFVVSDTRVPGWVWSSVWVDTLNNTQFVMRRANNVNGIANYPENQQTHPLFKGANTGYWKHLVWNVNQNLRNPSDDWRNAKFPYMSGQTPNDSIWPEPPPQLGETTSRTRNFTYRPQQDIIIGSFTQTEVVQMIPQVIDTFYYGGRDPLTSLPNINQNAVATVFATTQLTGPSAYTFDQTGQIQETDKFFFTSQPNVTTGTTFTLIGLVNTGSTQVVYQVFEFDSNSLRADPPWFNHVPNTFDELANKNIIFTQPSQQDQTKFGQAQITELAYVGLDIPYYSGDWGAFNKIRLTNVNNVSIGSTFRLRGGPKSPMNTVFTIISGPDANGYWTMSPGYSITSYQETEQWLRDNEAYINFNNFELNRTIVFYNNAFNPNLITVRSVRDNDKLILENIPNQLATSATFISTLTNFAGTYTITVIDPLREMVTISPSWSSTQTQYLSQWIGKEFTFTNPPITTSLINLGSAQALTSSTNLTYTWRLTRFLNPGTYSIQARLTPQIELGFRKPFRYASSSTISYSMQSANGLNAPLDLEYEIINSTQTKITVVCRGSTSQNPDHYYVFPNPVEFYSNNIRIGITNWVRQANELEQRASQIFLSTQLINFEIRWAGSMNYARTYSDQFLFLPATLAFVQDTSTLALNILGINNQNQIYINSPDQFGDIYFDNIISVQPTTSNRPPISGLVTLYGDVGQLNRTTGQYAQTKAQETLITTPVINNIFTSRFRTWSGEFQNWYSLTPVYDVPKYTGTFPDYYISGRHFRSYLRFRNEYSGDLLTKSSQSTQQSLIMLPQNRLWSNSGSGQITTATIGHTELFQYNVTRNFQPILHTFSAGNVPLICIECIFGLFAEPETVWNSAHNLSSSTVNITWFTNDSRLNAQTGRPEYIVRQHGAYVGPNQWRGPENQIEEIFYQDANFRNIKYIKVRKYIQTLNSNSPYYATVSSFVRIEVSWPNNFNNNISFSLAKDPCGNVPNAGRADIFVP